MKLENAIQLEKTTSETTASGVFASMVTETSFDRYLAKPKSNPYVGRIVKISNVSDLYLYQGQYETLVNNRRDKNDLDKSFVAQSPRGMHHVDGHDLLLQSDKDQDKWYLRAYFPKNGNTRVKTEYLLDGQSIDIETLRDFIVPSFFTDKEEGGSQGLDNDHAVIVRSYSLESIKKLKMGDFQFSV